VQEGTVEIEMSAGQTPPRTPFAKEWLGVSYGYRPGSQFYPMPPQAMLPNGATIKLPTFPSRYWIHIDLWLPLVLAILYPIVAVIRGPLRRYRLTLKDCCTRCGYSLTGLIEPRCPECGSGFPPDLLKFPEIDLDQV